MNRQQKIIFGRIILSSVILFSALLLPLSLSLKIILYFLSYLTAGYSVLFEAAENIIRLKAPDESFLMSVASIGAIVLAFANGSGDFADAVAVMFLYETGEFFEDYAVEKSRKNISSLLAVRPDSANLVDGNRVVTVSPDDIKIGSIIEVKAGERIPLDGVITDGCTSVDTSAVTGESFPREATVGDNVFSGCINLSGTVRVRTEKTAGESTASKILSLVESASERKTKHEAFISRFAAVYTPIVCISAVLIALLPPLSGLLFNFSAPFSTWLYRGLTFLVISCPCALVISVPLTFFAGIGGMGKDGILIKGSEYIEKLSNADTFVFDKTGTLTTGKFEVTEVHPVNITKDELLGYASAVEAYSSHPIALAVTALYPKPHKAEGITEYSGEGTVGIVDGNTVSVGNRRLMSRLGVDTAEVSPHSTAVYVSLNGRYVGSLILSDTVKDGAEEAIASLHGLGIRKAVMLTGDIKSSAEKVADKLRLDGFLSELMPEDKVFEVEKLLKSTDGSLVYVGDGINDAPSLVSADVGIAMGALGSDAAVEAADVVIMDDNISKLSLAVKKARRCMRIAKENITFSIAVKALCLILGALGIVGMWSAVFADVGVMVICVINALRATLKCR